MNRQALEISGVTMRDFEMWCKANKKNKTSVEHQSEFFRLIQTGKLMKNLLTNEIVKTEDIRKL